jgi:hypothetical protein
VLITKNNEYKTIQNIEQPAFDLPMSILFCSGPSLDAEATPQADM